MRILDDLDELAGADRRGARHQRLAGDRPGPGRTGSPTPPATTSGSTSTWSAPRPGPFGGTIAHGYLTLSLIPLPRQPGLLPRDARREAQLRRQQGPLPAPGAGRLAHPRPRRRWARSPTCPAGKQLTLRHIIEIEGQAKPACVAETVVLLLELRLDPQSASGRSDRRGRGQSSAVVSGATHVGCRRRRTRPRATSRARSNRLGLVGEQREQRLALVHRRRRGARARRRPAPAWTASSLRARPAPSRQAARPTAIASSRVSVARRRRGDDVRLAGRGQRRVGVAALGRDHGPPGVHGRAVGQLVGRVDVVAPGAGQHLAGEGQRSAPPRRPGRRRPAPRPTPHLDRVARRSGRAASTCR